MKKKKLRRTVSTILSFKLVAAFPACFVVDIFANVVEIRRTRQIIEKIVFIFFVFNLNDRCILNES